MKYLARIGIGNKVDNVSIIDVADEMTDNQALRYIKDITNNENWVIANEKVGAGSSYDAETGIFTLPKPFPSYVLNSSENPNTWEAPVEKNGDTWDEASQSWTTPE
tara:strand:+ start:251 stop:568 length:318 start_codon:yes stop_codon:yes gene_type:complete